MSYGYPYSPQPVYAPQYQMRHSAPVSIHIVAILQYLGGLFALAVAGLLALVAVRGSGALSNGHLSQLHLDDKSTVGIVFGLTAGFAALFGLIAIWIGRRLQVGRNWARVLLILLNLISVAGTVFSFATAQAQGSILVSLAFPLLYLILLNTRAARSWCKYRTY